MAKHMLIDATHPEEIRVVVVDGKRLEEFDFESASKKQLKGNIYLAKVTRVEPSLQAAFVEYGGNRHGFLAFSEIHPDYYRIPVADREALLAAEAREAAAEEAREDAREAAAEARRSGRGRGGRDTRATEADDDRAEAAEDDAEDDSGPAPEDEPTRNRVPPELWPAQALEYSADRLASAGIYDIEDEDSAPAAKAEPAPGSDIEAGAAPDAEPAGEPAEAGGFAASDAEVGQTADTPADESAGSATTTEEASPGGQAESKPTPVETIGGDEADEVQPRRSPRGLRSYKIQEVIKRRQVMLVQVTKEERGTKGAALTTYLSLAGRYCVLMPNTARGGGVSRKISSPVDRKRLKAILEELDIPEGMAVIIRTAGAERSKAELKRDYEYLLRLWDEIRELTLKSTAPALVYEEANLIKRSIRDLYSRDIEDVIVDGEEGYKVAKSFMRTLTPSHAKRVQLYRDPTPLFHRHQVESQLDAIHNPVVQLKSGGYIVINSTEALVAIDVNSGRATRERNIEETAYKTNLEAAEEIARQLRLRDLAGLIVIDFIDMEESRHNAAVERKLKEAMRHDRARIQIGRISAFGLLELSRQRMRPSLFETSTEICQHCRGTGHVRSTESTVLHVLRSIEDECLKSRAAAGLSVAVPTAVALYILNHKRKALAEIELRHGMRIFITGDDHLIPPEYRVERIKALAPSEQVRPAVMQEIAGPVPDEAEEIEAAEDEDDEEEAEAVAEDRTEGRAEGRAERDAGGEDRRHKRSRRRRRGRDRDHEGDRDRGHDRGRGAPGTPKEAPGDVEPRIAPQIASGTEDVAEATGGAAEAPRPAAEDGGAEEPRRRRRRGRRGGRRRRRPGEGQGEFSGDATAEGAASAGDDGLESDDEAAESAESEADADGVFAEAAAEPEAAPKSGRRRRRGRRPGAAKDDMGASGEDAEVTADGESAEPAPMAAAVEAEQQQEPEFEPAAEPWRTVETVEPLAAAPAETRSSEWPRREPQESVPVAAAPAPAVEAPAIQAPAIQAPAAESAPAGPPRKGWWRRLAQ